MSSRQSHKNKIPPSQFPLQDNKHSNKLHYQLHDILGKGAFATVYKCQSIQNRQLYACKVINTKLLKSRQHYEKLRTEIKLHRTMQHKNIILLHNHFIDGQWVYMILELSINGSLLDIIRRRKKITEPEAALWFKQMVQTIKYLHGQRIIHRDLKLGNILLDKNMNIKLCDFGLAAKLEHDNQRRTTFCGTPNYIAPEILSGKQNGGHSYEVDIWSLGVLLYSLLCGKPPFETNNIKDTYNRIQHLKYRFPFNNQLSEPCKNIIKLILKNKPSERLTLDFMLLHTFLNGDCPMPVCIPICARFRIPTKEQLFPNYTQVRHTHQSSNTALRTIINHKYMGNRNVSNNNNNKNVFRNDNNVFRNENDCKSIEAVNSNNHEMEEAMKSMTMSNKNSSNMVLYIIDWIDYRKRYGIGYILSNGFTGIYFNDCTKILSKNQSILYIDMNGKTYDFMKKQYPKNLTKKMTLLMHFESYLKSKLTVEQNEAIKNYRLLHFNDYGSGNGSNTYGNVYDDGIGNVFLKILTSTTFAKLFVLSNNTIQMDFNDGSRVITCAKSKLVVYTNKEQRQQIILFADAVNTEQRDLRKRIHYMQDILKGMFDDDGQEGQLLKR